MSQWIKCTTKMPYFYDTVLVVMHQQIHVAIFHPRLGVGGKGDFGTVKKGKRTTSIEQIKFVSHWMPLPKLPPAAEQGER